MFVRLAPATRPGRLLAAIGLLALAFLVALLLTWVRSMPTTAQAAEPGLEMSLSAPTVSVGSLSLSNVGDQGKVNVEALKIGQPGLGSWTMDVSYDPAVVSLISCAPASIGGAFNDCNDAFAADTLRIVGFVGGGLIGDTMLGSLTFRCESAGISSIVINTETFVFVDSTPGNPQAINADIQDGSISCGAPSLVGDVDCDGEVTIADAQLIAQLVLGRISELDCPDAADVDESGDVTIADAQLIAQLILGRISSLPPL